MIPSTWQQRQKDQEFKASLGSVRLCLEKVKVESEEAGEVAQRLRTAALLPGGLCLALSLHAASVQRHTTPASASTESRPAHGTQTYMWGRHT